MKQQREHANRSEREKAAEDAAHLALELTVWGLIPALAIWLWRRLRRFTGSIAGD